MPVESIILWQHSPLLGSQNWLSEGGRSLFLRNWIRRTVPGPRKWWEIFLFFSDISFLRSRNTKNLIPFFCLIVVYIWSDSRTDFFPLIISLGMSFPAICSRHYNREITSHVSNLSFAFRWLYFLWLFVLFQRFIFTAKHSDFVEKSKLCWICGGVLFKDKSCYICLYFPFSVWRDWDAFRWAYFNNDCCYNLL